MCRVFLVSMELVLFLCGTGLSADHWAFQAPVRTEIAPGRNPIDHFIDARLAAAGVQPLPATDPQTLLRRLHLDLTGLPPTLEEMATFEADRANDPASAITRLVDRLLDSPLFAERWARHWLDLARYADSDGYLGDTERAWAWRYRDWVVDAIDRDLPYDQFSITQLAGDLLTDSTAHHKTATGYHRNALRNTEAGVDKELSRTKEVLAHGAVGKPGKLCGETGHVVLGTEVDLAQQRGDLRRDTEVQAGAQPSERIARAEP